MREIKFRAWDKKEKSMRFVLRIEWNTDCPDKLEYVETYPLRRLLPLEVELLRFTGLLDKNGKEIYEGDILEGCPSGWKEPRTRNFYLVEWKDDGWKIDGSEPKVWFHVSGCGYQEVIGNIHEHSALLKENERG